MRSAVVLAAAALLAACSEDPVSPAAPPPATPAPEAPADVVVDGTPTPLVELPRCPAEASASPDVVVTSHGPVRGKKDGDTWAWKGIRYAAPPTGALRFAKPVEPACIEGVHDAFDYGAQCPQLGASLDVVDGDEDCLFLNVWSPPRAADERLPVLFFIHGGAEILGSASQETTPGFHLYDGKALAEEADAVVVTVNYRLGALGFLAHEALEDPFGRAGNYGVHDLLLALRWVRDNAAAFGGDPSRVMIFGESAGGLNVCTLVASPLAAGLFATAIMESGGCDAPTLAQREADGAVLVERFGCADAPDVATCLRDADVGTLVRAAPVQPPVERTWWLPYGPNVDGEVLFDAPIATIEAGLHNRVPFVVGSNEEEMNFFVPQGTVNTCVEYELALRGLAPEIADEVLEIYPCLSYWLPHETFVAALSDLVFTSQARRAARAASRWGPTYRYFFQERADWGPLFALGSFHAFELFYVFDKLDAQPGYVATDAEEALAKRVQGYWGRFAATGDPNDGDAPAWPLYDAAADTFLGLDEEITAGADLRTEGCDFWDVVWASGP